MPRVHSSIGKYIGSKGSNAIGGILEISSMNKWAIPTTGLITHLDAGSKRSYPGTGTVWYDLSPSGYNYNIVANAFKNIGPQYMDFNGFNGIAKSEISVETSAPSSYTILVWTRIRNTTPDWRTLYRPYQNDHTVIGQDGSWSIGMYDNEAAGFLTSGFSQQDFPGSTSGEWILMHFRITNSASPYWKMSYNDTPSTSRGTITDSRAYSSRMLGNLGGWGNGTTTPSDSSQHWGDISAFYMYNRILADEEILQLFNSTRNRYGI